MSVSVHGSGLSDRSHKPISSSRRLVYSALLTAIGVVLGVAAINFPIRLFSVAPYLVYDPADVPIIVGTLIMGSGQGLLITVAVAVIMSTFEAGWIGALMHIAATGCRVVVIAALYHLSSSKYRYAAGAVLSTLAGTVVMVALNLLITPLYTGMPAAEIAKLLVPAIIPFNLLKGAVNSILAWAVFAAVTPYLRKTGVLRQ